MLASPFSLLQREPDGNSAPYKFRRLPINIVSEESSRSRIGKPQPNGDRFLWPQYRAQVCEPKRLLSY